MKKGKLHLFTNSFPLSTEESFLYNEIEYLALAYDQVFIFPMHLHGGNSVYELPSNVEVVMFNMYQAYNRLFILFRYFFSVIGAIVYEVKLSKNRWQYISQFRINLNGLLHKIAMSALLHNYLTKKNQSIVVAYSYWFNQWVFVLTMMKRHFGNFKLYTRIHGSDVYEDQHPEPDFYFQFRQLQLKYIDRILSISQNGLDHLLNQNALNSEKVLVARLGVKDHGKNNYQRQSFFRIVSCSAIQKYKRLDLIIAILNAVIGNVEWVHFGNGEKDLEQEFLNRVKALPKTIHFIYKGYQPNEAVMQFYNENRVDLFINVSESEGIPVSIMEALSFGIPVMATDVGGVKEIVNAKNGWLIGKDFIPSEIAAMISQLIISEDEVSVFNKRVYARSFWLEHYSSANNYMQLINYLK